MKVKLANVDRQTVTAIAQSRKISLAAGLLYLLTFVSVPTLALYGQVKSVNYIISPGPDSSAIIGGILEIIVALAGICTAVVLFPVLKKQNESAALGLVAARILESGTIFVGVAFLLSIVTLRQVGAGADALITVHALAVLYDRIFLLGQSFMPAICVFFGVIGQHTPLAGMSAFPVALFEFSLGVWFTVKGFNPLAVRALESKK